MTATMRKVECTSCHTALVLECEGLPAYAGYETQNEFFCPKCKKQNHAKTPGAIASARVA
jgi:phage FluMu protein Com